MHSFQDGAYLWPPRKWTPSFYFLKVQIETTVTMEDLNEILV